MHISHKISDPLSGNFTYMYYSCVLVRIVTSRYLVVLNLCSRLLTFYRLQHVFQRSSMNVRFISTALVSGWTPAQEVIDAELHFKSLKTPSSNSLPIFVLFEGPHLSVWPLLFLNQLLDVCSLKNSTEKAWFVTFPNNFISFLFYSKTHHCRSWGRCLFS